MKKLNRVNIIWIAVILTLAILVLLPNKSHTPSDYSEMSAGQLLDRQLVIEQEIATLVKDKNEVQGLRDSKTASLRGQSTGEQDTTVPVVDSVTDQVDESLGL